MDRETLLKQLMEADFILYDTSLFLDTHPDNQMALDFFRAGQYAYDEALAAYEASVGPVVSYDVNTESGWTWVQGPWPWEMEG